MDALEDTPGVPSEDFLIEERPEVQEDTHWTPWRTPLACQMKTF